MSEFIGSRISLVSRSDIRYVGTLHEINSDTSTVALENVTSFGTEGRRNNPDEEIPASDSIYEYIVFRGSDVKDLRIEEAPAAKENKPPQVPNDPAILGSGSRPQAQAPQNRPTPQQNQPSQPPIAPQQGLPQQGPPQQGPPQFPHSPYPPHFYPPPQWGRGGPGFPPMPYGGPPPPGWYPPPGQGFPGGPMPPYGQFPLGPPPPGQHFQQQQQQQQQAQNQAPKPSPIGPGAPKQPSPPTNSAIEKPAEKVVELKSLTKPDVPAAAAPAPIQPQVQSQAPAPAPKVPSPIAEPTAPVEEKKVLEKSTPIPTGPAAAKNTVPTKPKNSGRILPAIPLQSAATPKGPPSHAATAAKVVSMTTNTLTASAAIRDATQAATAAVAAAMAKLPPTGQQTNGTDAVDDLTRKVNEMRTDAIRAPRQPGAGGFSQGHRGRGRGGSRQESRKVEVPETDFDFQTSNAKFNKEEIVKEVIDAPNGSATENTKEVSKDESLPTVPSYNKSTSFFDNISSEIKDRQEANGARPGGREWRGEEQKKNLETFGQGSVDNGYRGGYRGRGRGRGGIRGRGYGGMRGRGGYRGRSEAHATAQ